MYVLFFSFNCLITWSNDAYKAKYIHLQILCMVAVVFCVDMLANMQSAYQQWGGPLHQIILFKCPLLTKALFISRWLRSLDNSPLSDKGLVSYQKFIKLQQCTSISTNSSCLDWNIYLFKIQIHATMKVKHVTLRPLTFKNELSFKKWT